MSDSSSSEFSAPRLCFQWAISVSVFSTVTYKQINATYQKHMYKLMVTECLGQKRCRSLQQFLHMIGHILIKISPYCIWNNVEQLRKFL